MPIEIHALVQNTDYENVVRDFPIEDYMSSEVRTKHPSADFVDVSTEPWVISDKPQSTLQDLQINFCLSRAISLRGVLIDFHKVPTSPS